MKMFFTKSFALFVLFLVLQIPLNWTESTINERSNYRQQAINSIAQNQANAQTIIGPVLSIPYTRTYWYEHEDGDKKIVREQRVENRSLSLLPNNLNTTTTSTVEERKKGIFPVPVFNNALTITGDFTIPDINTLKVNEDDVITIKKSTLNLSIADQRGIKSVKPLDINNHSVQFLPGTDLFLQNNQGLHTFINYDYLSANTTFKIELSLIGTKSYSIVPIGAQNKLSMESNWPHPQFIGSQLPDERNINNAGFTANWQTTELATNIHTLWNKCQSSANDCQALLDQEVGVSLFESVDIYQQTTRTAKYGLLFLAITFATFLLYEVLCQLNIHPVQYGLVGLALALFFLLLLSFAEHIGFARAYLIASTSCITLLSFYVHAVLKHWLRTSLFSTILISLYAAIYVILQLEDAALLTGSVLLFGLLALAMTLTRKIDWYSWQQQLTQKSTDPSM